MLPKDGRPMRIVSSHHGQGEFEKKSQTGIYGKFVCQCCENRFTRWDTYASVVLRRVPARTVSGWDYGTYKYGDLARFYLSVLWRAQACGQPFFETVDLGSRASVLADVLLSKSDAGLAEFEIWPTRSNHIFAYGLLTPFEAQVEAVPYWQLFMPLFQALIKVAAQPGASCVQPEKMRPDTPLLLREKTFKEFGEERGAMQIFKANMEKKNARCH
nr:hypothetical protein [Rhodoferax sp.]